MKWKNKREEKDGLLFTNRGCGYSIYHTLCTSFTSVDGKMYAGTERCRGGGGGGGVEIVNIWRGNTSTIAPSERPPWRNKTEMESEGEKIVIVMKRVAGMLDARELERIYRRTKTKCRYTHIAHMRRFGSDKSD